MKYTRCERLLLVKAFFLFFLLLFFRHLKISFGFRSFHQSEVESMLAKIEGLFKTLSWNSRTFQGFTLKFKDFSRLCEPCSQERSIGEGDKAQKLLAI